MPSSPSHAFSVAENAFAHQIGVEHAAVEQDVRRARQTARSAPHRAVLRGGCLLSQEARHVARDRGVGGIGQTELLQSGAPLVRGHLRARHRRQEALAKHLHDIARGDELGRLENVEGGKSRSSASRSSMYARAELVVPRSMPIFMLI